MITLLLLAVYYLLFYGPALVAAALIALVIRGMIRGLRQPHTDDLVAVGGWCAPLAPYYDIPITPFDGSMGPGDPGRSHG